MGKKKTSRVTIELTFAPKIMEHLEEMLASSLWGDTLEEVCITLLREGIREALKSRRDMVSGMQAFLVGPFPAPPSDDDDGAPIGPGEEAPRPDA